MSRGDKHFSKSKAITVFNFLDLEFVFGPAFVTHKNFRGFQSRTEFARTAHEISMNVRLENMRDRHARFPSHVNVNVAVRPGIEHRCNAFIIVADQIGKFCDALGLDSLENERHAKS